MQTYSKQYWYWWQTQDDRLWGDVWYLYSENINPFTSTWSVELSRKPTTVQSTGGLVTAYYRIKYNYTEYWLFVSNETFYKEWIVWTWGQNSDPTYPNLEDRQIKHFFQIWDYVYWTYNKDETNSMVFWRFASNEIANSSLTAPTYGYTGTFSGSLNPSWSSWIFKQYILWNIAYLTMWSKISVVDFGANTITNYDFWGEHIMSINYSGSSFLIALKWWKVWTWDGVTEWPWELWEFPDYIVDAITLWSDNYVICGQYQGYWLTSPTLYKLWQGIEKLFTQTKSTALNESKFRIVFNSNQSITKVRDFIVMIDQSNTGKDRIAVYGNSVKWLPKWYVVLNTRNGSWEDMVEIWFVKWVGNRLYFSWSNSTTFWVDYINFDPFALFEYETTGFICTNVEDMWDKVIRKAKCQLHTALSDITGGSVDININTDLLWYEAVWTVTELDYSWVDRYAIQGNFRDISVKYTLNRWNTSPRLYWLKIENESQRV